MLPEPGLRHAADFDIDLDPVREMGDGRGGKRRRRRVSATPALMAHLIARRCFV